MRTVTERQGDLRICRDADVPQALVLDLAERRDAGRLVKRSPHFETRIVGDHVVKRSVRGGLYDRLKRSLLPSRARRPWDAAAHLAEHGAPVPAPIAFVERIARGVVIETVYISRCVAGACTVEEHARALIAADSDEASIRAFLRCIDEAVARLTAAGAYHADLSGKNLISSDGSAVWIVDLDAVRIGVRYTRSRRMRNHVQLYDSFCDLWPPAILDDLITPLAPSGVDPARWTAEVRRRQALRRAKHRARIERNG